MRRRYHKWFDDGAVCYSEYGPVQGVAETESAVALLLALGTTSNGASNAPQLRNALPNYHLSAMLINKERIKRTLGALYEREGAEHTATTLRRPGKEHLHGHHGSDGSTMSRGGGQEPWPGKRVASGWVVDAVVESWLANTPTSSAPIINTPCSAWHTPTTSTARTSTSTTKHRTSAGGTDLLLSGTDQLNAHDLHQHLEDRCCTVCATAIVYHRR